MAFSNRKALSSFAFSLPLVLPNAAIATYAPPESVASNDTIVVTGQSIDKKAVKQEAANFVRTIITLPNDGQYARRKDPICPEVIGIDRQYVQIVEKHIRDIAEAVGADVAPQKCKTNLAIIFTLDSEKLISNLKKNNPRLFLHIPILDRKDFFVNKNPVRWWYNLHVTGSDGRDLISNLGQGAAGSIRIPISGGKGFNRYLTSSLIDTNLIVNVAASSVVVDINKLNGFSFDSINAYIAMVSLAHIRQDAEYTGAPSILGIFNAAKTISDAPRDLTNWDYAYLRALYKTPLNRDARVQRFKLVGAMAKELAGEQNTARHPK